MSLVKVRKNKVLKQILGYFSHWFQIPILLYPTYGHAFQTNQRLIVVLKSKTSYFSFILCLKTE